MGQLFCYRSLGPGCRRLAPDRCQRAAFRLGPGAGTRTGSVVRRAVVYRWAAHRAVPAQASLPRTPNRPTFERPVCTVPPARARLLDRLDRSDVRLIVSGHLHQHRDRTFGGQRHLWVSAVAFAAPQAHGGDGRCGITVLDFSQNSAEVTIERPRELISHDLAAIKGHGRYQFLRDMPPSPPPHAG